MTPVSAIRSALLLLAVAAAVVFVDVAIGAGWPERAPEILRGLIGALAVLAVGALFFAFRELQTRSEIEAAAAVALGSTLIGTIVVLIGVGLLSSVPADRAMDVVARPAVTSIGLTLAIAGVIVAARTWASREK